MQIWRSKACLPAGSLLGHPRSPFKTALEGDNCLCMKDFISLDVAELTGKCQPSVYKTSRTWSREVLCQQHHACQKRCLHFKLHARSQTHVVPWAGLTWPRPMPCTTPKISHYRWLQASAWGHMPDQFGLFMIQKSLGLSVLFRTPGAMQGVKDPSPS